MNSHDVIPLFVSAGVIIGIAVPIIRSIIAEVSDQVTQQVAWKRQKRLEAERAKAERKRQREEELARIDAHKAQQRSYHTELVTLGNASLGLFEDMPAYLLNAEELLEQAERDFQEGAFSPFWDSIEQATVRLGSFDSSVDAIGNKSKRYTQLVRVYEATPPEFPIALNSVRGMAAASTTADRMKEIVRQAQRNFQFATIYEQRRTNQLLVAGFTNLAQALDGMGQRIASSIDGLSYQISDMATMLNSSLTSIGKQLQEGNQKLTETVDALHSTVQRDASERAERHDRALEMLDNIQRRRIPYPRKLGDRAY